MSSRSEKRATTQEEDHQQEDGEASDGVTQLQAQQSAPRQQISPIEESCRLTETATSTPTSSLLGSSRSCVDSSASACSEDIGDSDRIHSEDNAEEPAVRDVEGLVVDGMVQKEEGENCSMQNNVQTACHGDESEEEKARRDLEGSGSFGAGVILVEDIDQDEQEKQRVKQERQQDLVAVGILHIPRDEAMTMIDDEEQHTCLEACSWPW